MALYLFGGNMEQAGGCATGQVQSLCPYIPRAGPKGYGSFSSPELGAVVAEWIWGSSVVSGDHFSPPSTVTEISKAQPSYLD